MVFRSEQVGHADLFGHDLGLAIIRESNDSQGRETDVNHPFCSCTGEHVGLLLIALRSYSSASLSKAYGRPVVKLLGKRDWEIRSTIPRLLTTCHGSPLLTLQTVDFDDQSHEVELSAALSVA